VNNTATWRQKLAADLSSFDEHDYNAKELTTAVKKFIAQSPSICVEL
jgi:hypothetical protein